MFGRDGLGSDFADSSPDPSASRPHRPPNHPSNEIEALKQSLAHAQRQVNMLRGIVQRDELRMDYRRRLTEAEGNAEDFIEIDQEDPTKARSRTARGRGQGLLRIGKASRSGHSQKLAITFGIQNSEFLDNIYETEVQDISSEATLELKEQSHEEQPKELPVENEDEGISQVSDRRISADGMDPAFAHVLRNSPASPVLHGSSPLREMTSAPSRGGRRSRGAAPHLAEQRPSSLVEPAGALAAELGMTEETLGPEFTLPRHIETADFACQTEPELKPHPIPTPIIVTTHEPPPIETCEIAVQVEEVVSQVVTSEAGLQVAPSYVDAATDASVATKNDVQVQATPPLLTVEVDIQTNSITTQDFESVIPTNVGGITRRGTIVAACQADVRQVPMMMERLQRPILERK